MKVLFVHLLISNKWKNLVEEVANVWNRLNDKYRAEKKNYNKIDNKQ